MKRLAIIPARGGSKRIPRKNIKEFYGKPAIAYSIETAVASNLFDQVIVSTDDAEIASISKQYGASVPFLRSQKNSNDFAGTDEVLHEVIDQLELQGEIYDKVCCIYPVNPFIKVQSLKEGLDKMEKNQFDSVFSAVRYSYPIQRSFRLDAQEKMYLIQPEHFSSRSQDLEATYHDAAQFYWFKISSFRKFGRIWTDNTGIIEINEIEVQDIDTEMDWKLAEFKYAFLNK